VPSGVWSAAEYDKLPLYDEATGNQPPFPFACHATTEALCHGWAVVHSHRGIGNELLALRLLASVEQHEVVVPGPDPKLFSSGAEAAEHGKRDIYNPSDEAKETAQRLVRKYDRLK
jgi:hypothetical protein